MQTDRTAEPLKLYALTFKGEPFQADRAQAVTRPVGIL